VDDDRLAAAARAVVSASAIAARTSSTRMSLLGFFLPDRLRRPPRLPRPPSPGFRAGPRARGRACPDANALRRDGSSRRRRTAASDGTVVDSHSHPWAEQQAELELADAARRVQQQGVRGLRLERAASGAASQGSTGATRAGRQPSSRSRSA
jgi:hypothetical protein